MNHLENFFLRKKIKPERILPSEAWLSYSLLLCHLILCLCFSSRPDVTLASLPLFTTSPWFYALLFLIAYTSFWIISEKSSYRFLFSKLKLNVMDKVITSL